MKSFTTLISLLSTICNQQCSRFAIPDYLATLTLTSKHSLFFLSCCVFCFSYHLRSWFRSVWFQIRFNCTRGYTSLQQRTSEKMGKFSICINNSRFKTTDINELSTICEHFGAILSLNSAPSCVFINFKDIRFVFSEDHYFTTG